MNQSTKQWHREEEIAFARMPASLGQEPYCAADDCQNDAVYVIVHEGDPDNEDDVAWHTPLCEMCKMVYQWGQASPDAIIKEIHNADL